MTRLTDRFLGARRDPGLVVLEGFHPLKHALRFGAELLEVVVADGPRVADLFAALAPELALPAGVLRTVDAGEFAALSPAPPREPVMALARRPGFDADALLRDPAGGPIVLLEGPTYLGNVGAAVRVAAAAGATGLIVLGALDPWHPMAVRGGAGLQFALPCGRLDELPASDRPLIAATPEGQPLAGARIPARAILAFGSERRGVSAELRQRADMEVSIPMREGVSSLSLATAVAVVLYGGLGAGQGQGQGGSGER